jgi:hypothetical protein
MDVVTIEEMAEAIRRTMVVHGKLPAADADKVALQVLSYFGAEESILDNVVSAEDRDYFYRLEEEGLLSSEEEDTTVEKGKSWRIHYWVLNKAAIETASGKVEGKGQTVPIYDQLPAEDWVRGKKEEAPAKPKH